MILEEAEELTPTRDEPNRFPTPPRKSNSPMEEDKKWSDEEVFEGMERPHKLNNSIGKIRNRSNEMLPKGAMINSLSVIREEEELVEDSLDFDALSEQVQNENKKYEIRNKGGEGGAKISQYEVINQDNWLKPWEHAIKQRQDHYLYWMNKIYEHEGGLLEFARSYKKYGFQIKEGGISYLEWAPGAKALSLFGEFNNWNRNSHFAERNEFGMFKLFLKDNENGTPQIEHNTKVKICLTLKNGSRVDRNPAWSKYLVQNHETHIYDSVLWNARIENKHSWKYPCPKKPKSLRIYECHVGMSSKEPRVSTYREFADNIIPRIVNLGYTGIQLMAIMEHVYYGSFGYHVTSFFASSSRCGTPEDFKYLVDQAHGYGLYIILDCIHSHASMNSSDGINQFDGTNHQYFHEGANGYHKLWDSRLFNYAHWEVKRFLLSNIAWWMEEYKVDGFRFDAVTAILYLHRGIHFSFSGNLHEYFGEKVQDLEGICYLKLMNELVHTINKDAITIAEDVSGMPTLCRPVIEGGIGFDYRLNMSVPDKWIEYLKDVKDDNWSMSSIAYLLSNRRFFEKCVTYSESHDQAIVGDKTISMWLFDQEIYHGMDSTKPPSTVVDRGVALHKMIRLITMSLGGEAYLNFMGNEFGHPEWIDFPRPENNWSYHFCRRHWELVDDQKSRFFALNEFDKAMMRLDDKFVVLNARHQYITLTHEHDKVIVFERADLLFVFNFHPHKSYEHYRVGTLWGSTHKIVLNTDRADFGGKHRLQYGEENWFPIIKEPWYNRPNYIQIYLPSRTAMVLIAKENYEKYIFNEGIAKVKDAKVDIYEKMKIVKMVEVGESLNQKLEAVDKKEEFKGMVEIEDEDDI